MNYITLKTERNRRFTRAVREKLASERLHRASEAVLAEVLNSPVERGFFISVDHLIVMERRRREGTLPRMGVETARMWEEIFATFDGIMRSEPGITRTDAAAKVVSSGRASRFFISPQNARRILIRTCGPRVKG